MLATGSLVGAATAARVTTGSAVLLASRSGNLLRLAAAASAGGGGAPQAQAEFRDALLGLVTDASQLSWRELRRGVDELDRMTRSGDPTDGPARPYRVKP
jgi:uncharacterized protein YjiS (DUF1127 family)